MNVYDKVIGYECIKDELKMCADVLKNRKKYDALGVSAPGGILLHGDPGLGKTLMAKCFIEDAGIKTFMLRKDKPNGSFVDLIRETFENAKKENGAIVFLDDLDKFANEDEDHPNAEEYVSVQSCMDDTRDAGVFVIATANCKDSLPDSLLRPGRFDRIIEVFQPRGEDREAIINYYLSKKNVMGNVDMEVITELLGPCSCAGIETIINEAAIYAGYAGRDKVVLEDFLKAWKRITFLISDLTDPKEGKDLENITVHETGHVVVSEVLSPGIVAAAAVFNSHPNIEGEVQYKDSINLFTEKERREHRIISSLAGKAAMEVICGKTDMGCNSDMGRVFTLVESLIDDRCDMGFETFERASSSQYLLEKKDRLMASEVERYYKTAKRIIVENRLFFDAVYKELLSKKTITFRDIEEIKRHLKDPDHNSKEIKRTIEPYLCPQYTFESFNLNEENRLAYTAALGVSYNPGKMYNPLVLCGDTGSGKTHLLNAVGNYICMLNNDLNVLYLPAKKYISYINEGDDHALDEYRDVDVLIFDDFELLEGKEDALDAFTKLFKNLYENKKQIVIAMNCPFSHISGIPDKVIQILSWGYVVEIAK